MIVKIKSNDPEINGAYIDTIRHKGTMIEITPGWISVKDRLPDRNTQYIIALSTGGVTSGWYFGDCGGFFVAGVCITENVSYWQELPEPPKEG